MIKLEELTPKTYYKQSRDFQFIGRLYDLVLNSIKTNSDLLYSIPFSENSDSRLIDLMTLTLGFKSKHTYNIRQLTALCNAFSIILRNKGNITSLLTACNAILNAEGIRFDHSLSAYDLYSIQYDEKARANKLILYIPNELSDINLIKDLLDYTLPAGLSCEIVKTTAYAEQSTSIINSTDKLMLLSTQPDTMMNQVRNTISSWDSSKTADIDYAHNYTGLTVNATISNTFVPVDLFPTTGDPKTPNVVYIDDERTTTSQNLPNNNQQTQPEQQSEQQD